MKPQKEKIVTNEDEVLLLELGIDIEEKIACVENPRKLTIVNQYAQY